MTKTIQIDMRSDGFTKQDMDDHLDDVETDESVVFECMVVADKDEFLDAVRGGAGESAEDDEHDYLHALVFGDSSTPHDCDYDVIGVEGRNFIIRYNTTADSSLL